MQLQSFLDLWLSTVVQTTNSSATYRTYGNLVAQYIVPKIGEIRLKDLATSDVQRMVADLLDKHHLSTGTVSQIRSVLRTALNAAIDWKYVSHNAANKVKLRPVERQDIQPLTKEEVSALLFVAQGHRYEAIYWVAIGLGLRKGEIVRLRWEDIDFEQRTLKIQASKTPAGRRTLSIPEPVLGALQRHRDRQEDDKRRCGDAWVDHGLIFPRWNGEPIDEADRQISLQFKRHLDKAGVPDRRFHDLRHTCATFLIAQNVHVRVIMATLGHANISVTLNIYGHVLRETQEEAATQMGDLLTGLTA